MVLLQMHVETVATPPRILLDLAKLKFLNCGVGRLCLHLAQSLLKQAAEEIDWRFLLPRDRCDLFPGHERQCVVLRNWHRQRVCAWSQYLGLRPFSRVAAHLWHWTHQDSEYWPPDAAMPVILNILDLNFLYEGKGPLKTRQRLRRLQAKVDRATCLVAISQFTATEIRRHLDVRDKTIHVVHMGVESPVPRQGQRPAFLPPGEFLYTIGDISPKKNFHVLLALAEQLPEYRFVIAGRKTSDYARSLQQTVCERGLQKRVLMPGQIDDETRQWLYQHCRAFLFPSLAEGFGLPVIEAMMLGRPVFMSRLTSLPEIGGPLGFYWDRFEPAAMADVFRHGMRVVEDDPSYEQRLQNYAARYSWQRAARQYVDIYRSVLSQQFACRAANSPARRSA